MPSQILHTLFGEDVITEIYRRFGGKFGIVADKAVEKITGEYRTAFALGCQGPDIFYHNQRTRPVALEYGTLLHRRGYGMFTAALLKMGLPDPLPDEDDIRNHRREKGINALGAYALGFMTHAILDRRCHPYIIYKSISLDDIQTPPGRSFTLGRQAHPFFERILDVLMLRELRGMEVSAWDQAGILAEILEKPPLGLRELIARSLTNAYPERAGKDAKLTQRIVNTFSDAAFFYRLTAPARTAGRSPEDRRDLLYVYPQTLPPDADFLNLAHESWYHPVLPANGADDTPDTRSFPEIYAEAVQAAALSLSPCMVHYLDHGVFPIKDAAQAIGNGSLTLQDGQGKPLQPERTKPLDLEKVIQWRMISS
jgi:hypothetical protein